MAGNTIKTIYDSGDRRLVTAADFGMGLQGLKEYTDQKVGSGAKVTVDKELSSTSENPVANKAIKEALDAVSLRSAGNTVYAFNTDSSNPVGTGGIVEKEEYTDSSDESKNGIIYTLPSEYTKNGVPNILIDRCREETLPKNVYIKFPEEYVISDMKITVTLWDDYNTWVALDAGTVENIQACLMNIEMTDDGYINLNELYSSHINSYSNFSNQTADILTIFITGLVDTGMGLSNMAALSSKVISNEYPTATDADTLTTSIFNVPSKS